MTLASSTRPAPTRRLLTPDRALAAGALAGPLFVVASLAQVPFRPGFDLTKHAFSFLLLGPGGGVQLVTFVVAGLLFLASGPGLHAAMSGRTGRAAQVLVTMLGAGMIAGGVFPPLPYRGYPPGTVSVDHPTGTGAVHAAAFAVAMISWCCLLVVLARWFARRGRRRSAAVAGVLAVALLAVPATTGQPFDTVLLYVVVSTSYLATSALLLTLRGTPRPA